MTEETAGCLDMSKNCKNEKFYRSTVLKDYTPNSGTFKDFSYGANSITGWRLNQEDRYVCLPYAHFTRTWSFFGVYDGHGGEEVAEYLERKLHDHILEQLREYGDIKIALDEGFKACDNGIRTLTADEFNAIRDSVVKVFSESDYKPSTSDSASASKISENLLSEVKYEFFKRIMELQTDLNKVPFPLSTVEKSDNCEAEESKKDETKAVACSTRSKKAKVQNAAVSPVLEEKKTADEGIPLVGLSCGSTATVVVFTDAIIYVANIGDSRCIASVNGQVKSLSHDHRPLNKKEQKRILESGHKIARGRIDGGLNMSRAFGDFGLKDVKNLRPMLQAVIVEPTICAIEINDDLDFIVVASDGIWNNMENVEVLEFVSENIHLPLPEICAKIFEYILTKSTLRQGQDNMSMIIIKNDLKYKNAAKIETGKVGTKTAETEKMETEETETEKMETEETETEKMETEKTETKKTEMKTETRKIKRLKK